MQSLGLDIRVLDGEGFEVDLKQTFEDDDDIGLSKPVVADDEAFSEDLVNDGNFDGFGLQDENGEDIVEETEYSDNDVSEVL